MNNFVKPSYLQLIALMTALLSPLGYGSGGSTSIEPSTLVAKYDLGPGRTEARIIWIGSKKSRNHVLYYDSAGTPGRVDCDLADFETTIGVATFLNQKVK